ncbi:MAG: TonB-dependent receptor, partial [Thermodesulfobacteriota bacterium]|nr:TonB-dependent receptor [Thermodesulfobacteriota bacterium]
MYLSKDVKKPYISLLAIFMAAIFSVSPVLAQEPKAKSRLETEAERDRVYMKIGTVTVSEKTGYLTTADVPTSVDVLGSDQIENDNVDFGMELFRKLPGTYYGDWNQGIVSGTFSIRGFDANHDVPSALIIDGIPHNWARGSMDIQPIFPMEIERIELVKGTNDPRYGLNNIAGNVNIYTRQGGNYSQVKLLHGSYQSNEGDILVARENNGFSQNYFVGYRRTDGYREHSNLEKGAASGKWFYTTSDNRLTVGAIARFFDMDADSPGYLTKEQAEIDPRQAQSFARTDGG